MNTVAKSSATNAPGNTPQPPATGDWPSQFALMAAVLAGLAGDRAKFRGTSDWESVVPLNLLISGQNLRLLTLLSRITDGAKELQNKLVAASMALRTDLLQEYCGGPRRGRKGDDEPPLLIREIHIQALLVDVGDEISESAALDNLQSDVTRGRQALREDALHRPLMMLDNPEVQTLTELVAGCHGGRALVLGDMPVTTRPTRSRFMRLLKGATVTPPCVCARSPQQYFSIPPFAPLSELDANLSACHSCSVFRAKAPRWHWAPNHPQTMKDGLLSFKLASVNSPQNPVCLHKTGCPGGTAVGGLSIPGSPSRACHPSAIPPFFSSAGAGSSSRRQRQAHHPAVTTARSPARGLSPGGRASIAASPSCDRPPPLGSICRKCPIAPRIAPESIPAQSAASANVRAIVESCLPPSKKTVAGRFSSLHPSIGSA